uniref:Dirigent protein n=1 Tax=Leersia perrieri TaxID=77586 RepID=A0A0D9X1I9_9ORYZ
MAATYSPPPLMLVVLLLIASAAVAAAAGDNVDKLTRIRVYVHEKFAGANTTALTAVQSPLGAGETFGRVLVLDDELRDGADRAKSALSP